MQLIDSSLTEYGRNPEGRRHTTRRHQRHHRTPSYRRNDARTGSSCQHRPRKSVCTRPWRRSSTPGWGNTGWRWPSFHARRHRNPAPWGYARSNRPFLHKTKNAQSYINVSRKIWWRVFWKLTLVSLISADLLGDVLDLQKQLHTLDGSNSGLGDGSGDTSSCEILQEPEGISGLGRHVCAAKMKTKILILNCAFNKIYI